MDDVGRRLKELEKYLARRLRAIYLLRDGGIFQVILGAESVPDMIHRYRYLSSHPGAVRGAIRNSASAGSSCPGGWNRSRRTVPICSSSRNEVGAERERQLKSLHQKPSF